VELPSWVIVSLPVGALLAGVFFGWRYMRRGTSALHRAAAKGKVSRLEQFLLANPESVNRPDLVGFSPLQYAAIWGQVETARLLLAYHAHLTNEKGLSPLHYAAAGGHEAVVHLLLEHGSDVNLCARGDGSTPLHSAVIHRRADMTRLLLEKGADSGAKTKSGWTACHFAAEKGDEATMIVLLEHQADWHAVNADQKSPLELALDNGHRKIVELVRQFQNRQSAEGG